MHKSAYPPEVDPVTWRLVKAAYNRLNTLGGRLAGACDSEYYKSTSDVGWLMISRGPFTLYHVAGARFFVMPGDVLFFSLSDIGNYESIVEFDSVETAYAYLCMVGA